MKSLFTPFTVTAAALAILIVAGLVAFLVDRAQSPGPSANPAIIRDDTHVLDDGGEDAVTVVEFLDFECEACGATYPVVEELREKYAGRITYAVRYFPLPGHANSTTAAVAAEAAAQQGRFEHMYHRLFQTQSTWGEAQESQADMFRRYAAEMGLDMVAYDAAVADPATTARVRSDFDDARALGVRSTPTFFVDGAPLVLQSVNDLENAVKAAIER